jgi:molecular chaperone Hsp33
MTDERPGRLVTALGCERKVRVLVAVMDGPAREMCRRHELGPGAARTAAECLVAAALLSSQVKGREQLSVNVYGEQPDFRFNADVRDEGAVRARFEPPDLPVDGDGLRFHGLMAMLKFLGDEELYRGMADVEGDTVEGALQGFLDRSIQVDGRARLQVRLDDDGALRSAGGMVVERLPDMEPEAFASVFDQPLEEDFDTLMTTFAFGQLAGQPVEVMESQEVVFRCECSADRVRGMLQGLGVDELRSMIAEQGGAEVTCHFCNEVYRLEVDDLENLIEEISDPH